MNDSIGEVMNNRIESIANEINDIIIRYISANPDTELAADLFGVYGSYDVVAQTIDVLSEKQKNGPFKDLIQRAIAHFESVEQKKEAEAKVLPGMPATDFTLKDMDGKDVSLSSFKGKYVVIDFWGVWCKWCLKGIPEMKKYYDKYKNDLVIIGVDCGDKEDTWSGFVKENKLPWVNLYNGNDPAITNEYAVAGFPTKVIVDKEGKIVKTIVGESPEFYELLDSLLGKKK